MTMIHVIVDDRDGPFRGLADKEFIEAKTNTLMMMGLPDGKAAGKPSVAIFAELPDGTFVFIETTLAAFQMAAAAFLGRYGQVG